MQSHTSARPATEMPRPTGTQEASREYGEPFIIIKRQCSTAKTPSIYISTQAQESRSQRQQSPSQSLFRRTSWPDTVTDITLDMSWYCVRLLLTFFCSARRRVTTAGDWKMLTAPTQGISLWPSARPGTTNFSSVLKQKFVPSHTHTGTQFRRAGQPPGVFHINADQGEGEASAKEGPCRGPRGEPPLSWSGRWSTGRRPRAPCTRGR